MNETTKLADILEVSTSELSQLVSGLSQGTIASSTSVAKLRKAGVILHAEVVHDWLDGAAKYLGSVTSVIGTLRLVLAERERSQNGSTTPEFILTGPVVAGNGARETRVVVRELFESAKRSILVVGYAFHGCDHIFEPLAARMSRNSKLTVRLVVNVHFEIGRSPDDTIKGFAREFLYKNWPFEPRPEIYYDPRSLDSHRPASAIVHAKMIVIDDEVLYLGSANFTNAAFERNIEAGLRVSSETLGSKATESFDQWIRSGHLVKLPLE